MTSKEKESILEVLTEVDRLFKLDRVRDGDRWSYGLVYPHTFTQLIPKIENIIYSLSKDSDNE
jgi:hypothetical protein